MKIFFLKLPTLPLKKKTKEALLHKIEESIFTLTYKRRFKTNISSETFTGSYEEKRILEECRRERKSTAKSNPYLVGISGHVTEGKQPSS